MTSMLLATFLSMMVAVVGCRALIGKRHERIVAASYIRAFVFLSDGVVTLRVWLLLFLALQVGTLSVWASRIVIVRRVRALFDTLPRLRSARAVA